jgi:hypothetical protein
LGSLMSLPPLLNTPTTQETSNTWSFHHQDHHIQIVDTLQRNYNTFIATYIVDPIPQSDMGQWFLRHQAAHNDFNGVFGLDGNDLSSVDWSNEQQREAWIQLHFQEHQTIDGILRIASGPNGG